MLAHGTRGIALRYVKNVLDKNLAEILAADPKVSRFIHSQRIEQEDRSECAQIHIHPEDMVSLGAQRRNPQDLNSNGALRFSNTDVWLQPGTWIEEGIWTMPIDGVDL